MSRGSGGRARPPPPGPAPTPAEPFPPPCPGPPAFPPPVPAPFPRAVSPLATAGPGGAVSTGLGATALTCSGSRTTRVTTGRGVGIGGGALCAGGVSGFGIEGSVIYVTRGAPPPAPPPGWPLSAPVARTGVLLQSSSPRATSSATRTACSASE